MELTPGRRTHFVSFKEAFSDFDDPMSLTGPDPRHSIDEARQILSGRSAAGRLLIVIFTERGDTIRVISARRASTSEQLINDQG